MEGSSSFLKKRTKKLLIVCGRAGRSVVVLGHLFLVQNPDDEYPGIGLLVKDTVAAVVKLKISFPYMARVAPHWLIEPTRIRSTSASAAADSM